MLFISIIFTFVSIQFRILLIGRKHLQPNGKRKQKKLNNTSVASTRLSHRESHLTDEHIDDWRIHNNRECVMRVITCSVFIACMFRHKILVLVERHRNVRLTCVEADVSIEHRVQKLYVCVHKLSKTISGSMKKSGKIASRPVFVSLKWSIWWWAVGLWRVVAALIGDNVVKS